MWFEVVLAVLLRAGTSKRWIEHVGFEARRLNHKKRAVRPEVKMKIQQKLQQLLFAPSDIGGFEYCGGNVKLLMPTRLEDFELYISHLSYEV